MAFSEGKTNTYLQIVTRVLIINDSVNTNLGSSYASKLANSMAWLQPKLTATNASLTYQKQRTSKTQRGLRFISETAESRETMACLMLHKLTAASCIYTFMLVGPALRPAGPWAGKQRATATNTCVHARARACTHTLTQSTTEGPLCSAPCWALPCPT